MSRELALHDPMAPVHSVETGGMVDGPGVRFVVFTAGCPLSCVYCHNVDCQSTGAGTPRHASDVLAEVATYARFLKAAGGGLTISGGEPLQHPQFVEAVFVGAKERLGLHTALDTSGFLGKRASDRLLDHTDLVLLDIKSWEPETYRKVTGVTLKPTLEFAERLAARGNKVWLRYVLVPGWTDAPDNVAGVADFVAGLGNVERVDVLPFHKMGEEKWKALGIPYQLGDVQPPTAEQVAAAKALFTDRGLLAA